MKFSLVKNGRATCALIYAPSAQFAAEECRRYIARITGAKLSMMPAGVADIPRALFIGDELSAANYGWRMRKLPPQGFCIHADARRGWIVGADKMATLHGVYAFLEKWGGCHWCAPGRQNETAPRKTGVTLNAADHRSAPDLPLRGMQMRGWFGTQSVDQLDWMARNQMNFCAISELDAWPAFSHAALREIKEKRGMTLLLGCHVWNHFLNPNQYFRKHPEYFPLLNGRRIARNNSMVCTTHPDVPRIMAENVIMFLARNPGIDFLCLGQNDGNAWCECPRCRQLDEGQISRLYRPRMVATMRNLFLVNRIVEQVVRVFPRHRFAAFAYADTLEPPNVPGFHLHPNLDLIVALSGRMYDRPLAQGVRPDEHRTLPLDEYPADVLYAEFPGVLKHWRRIVPGRIFLHEYYMGVNACAGLPFPIYSTMTADMQSYREIGLDGFYAQHTPTRGNCGIHSLNYYLAARAGYRTNIGAMAIIRQYCRQYYGPAADPMCAYYRRLDQASSSKPLRANPNMVCEMFTPEVLPAVRECLRRAVDLAAGKQPWSRRVRQTAIVFQYTAAMVAIRDDFIEILRRHLHKGRIADVLRLMKNIARREARLLAFVRGKGRNVFGWVGSPDSTMDDLVNDCIKRQVFKLSTATIHHDDLKRLQHLQGKRKKVTQRI